MKGETKIVSECETKIVSECETKIVSECETKIVSECWVTFNINDELQFLNEFNTTISPDKLKIKIIQGIFRQKKF